MIGHTNKQTNRDYYFIYMDNIIFNYSEYPYVEKNASMQGYLLRGDW